MPAASSTAAIAWFADLSLTDIDQVGGKNASLGEMVRNLTSADVRVPDGFATTADAYRHFISDSGLAEMINAELAALDADDVQQLPAVGLRMSLPSTTIARSRIGSIISSSTPPSLYRPGCSGWCDPTSGRLG